MPTPSIEALPGTLRFSHDSAANCQRKLFSIAGAPPAEAAIIEPPVLAAPAPNGFTLPGTLRRYPGRRSRPSMSGPQRRGSGFERPGCLGDVGGNRIHQPRRQAVIGLEMQLLQPRPDRAHLVGR